ncbi:hypothetical protein [Alicyclobacillus dauci]|uniref:Uncharacterized protein n=1 Tax=Alicyclobacillus dauci TaxID=1475485 RepID=A0ABY6Z738_9BACL|nr:hypothetical protein [Alicyclobacillus dauci]WAH38700.1 hypothetical protein NZD86_09575 [Alicyclobacillus dauci]
MHWQARVGIGIAGAVVTWALTGMLTASTKVAITCAICVLVFSLWSAGRVYIFRRHMLRREIVLQYFTPILASVIVAMIVRFTHF